MDEDRDETTRRLFHFALEIISLLSGEDYTIVRKTPGDGVTPIIHLQESGGRSPGPITEPPPHSLLHERNKKILELSNKMIELLSGEVPIRCQDVAVYLSMEEWEYLEGHQDRYQDVMMEELRPLTPRESFSFLRASVTFSLQMSRPSVRSVLLRPHTLPHEAPSSHITTRGSVLTHYHTRLRPHTLPHEAPSSHITTRGSVPTHYTHEAPSPHITTRGSVLTHYHTRLRPHTLPHEAPSPTLPHEAPLPYHNQRESMPLNMLFGKCITLFQTSTTTAEILKKNSRVIPKNLDQ
ncbi:unnamed protein product [Ranitomeya imitator]|uniref:KRAB domain-containing protein n=1 Tax=Ranitomeya imitator TaxID=111125 RepID=A0ABN9LY08_9NEOB|nr:unnamed protein product [Ranitomeya imitator]